MYFYEKMVGEGSVVGLVARGSVFCHAELDFEKRNVNRNETTAMVSKRNPYLLLICLLLAKDYTIAFDRAE